MKQSKKSYNGWSILVLLLVGLLLAFVIFRYIRKRKQEQQEEKNLNDEIEENDSTDRERVLEGYKTIKQALKDQGIENENYIRLVTAQASFESDRFKSDVFKGNYNAFGMRQPSVRDTTSLGDINKDGYANYNSLYDSAVDYILWTRYNNLSTDFEDTSYPTIQKFVGALKSKGYFEDTLTHYIAGVKATMNELVSILNQG